MTHCICQRLRSSQCKKLHPSASYRKLALNLNFYPCRCRRIYQPPPFIRLFRHLNFFFQKHRNVFPFIQNLRRCYFSIILKQKCSRQKKRLSHFFVNLHFCFQHFPAFHIIVHILFIPMQPPVKLPHLQIAFFQRL